MTNAAKTTTTSHRATFGIGWALALVASCGGDGASTDALPYANAELPLIHWIQSGSRDARKASSTRDVRFHKGHLYTLSDRVQCWDAATGAELPPDDLETNESSFTSDDALHISSTDGYVGFSQGGRVYTGFSVGTPLLEATGTGYLKVTYVEGKDEFAAYDATALKFYDRASGELDREMPVEAGITKAVGGRRSFMTALPDHRIVVWPAVPDGKGLVLGGHGAKVIEMAYSQDESHMASADSTGLVIIWELEGGTEVQRLQLELSQAVPSATLAFFPGSQTLACNGKSREISFWSVKTGEQVHSLRVSRHGVLDIDVSEDGTMLAVGTAFAGRYDKNRITAEERFFGDSDLLSSGATLVFNVSSVPR